MLHRRLGLLLTMSVTLAACASVEQTQSQSGFAKLPPAAQSWIGHTERSLSSDGASQLDVKSVHTDRLEMTTVRMTHRYLDVRVVGSSALVTTDANGRVRASVDNLAQGLTVDVRPRFTETAAQRVALAAHGDGVAAVQTELVVFVHGGEQTLAWEVRVESDLEVNSGADLVLEDAYVDAQSGALLDVRAQVPNDTQWTSVTGTGLTPEDGLVDLDVSHVENDESGYSAWWLTSLEDKFSIINAEPLNNGEGLVYAVTSSDPDSWENEDYVEASHKLTEMRQLIADEYGWEGFLGDGTNNGATWPIDDVTRVYIDYPAPAGNETSGAFFGRWSAGWLLVFYDRDGGYYRQNPARADIIGHEYAHGVVAGSADLVYQDESGTLNEAFADVFGNTLERHLRGDDAETNWWIGEETVTENWIAERGAALRSLSDPRSIQDRPSEYSDRYQGDLNNGGVHINAGIPGHQFYLMVNGGAHVDSPQFGSIPQGIGWDDASQIWFRAMTVYTHSEATFDDARQAMVWAAEDLHGTNSLEVSVVMDAWHLVGVGEASSTFTPPAGDMGIRVERPWFTEQSAGTCFMWLDIDTTEPTVVVPQAQGVSLGDTYLLHESFDGSSPASMGAYDAVGPVALSATWDRYWFPITVPPETTEVAVVSTAGSLETISADCACWRADVTGDGVVDESDLVSLTESWGGTATATDVDTDGVVGSSDLTWMLRYMNSTCDS